MTNCECVECGFKTEINGHCADHTCPKCGGQLRRANRPGRGRNSGEG